MLPFLIKIIPLLSTLYIIIVSFITFLRICFHFLPFLPVRRPTGLVFPDQTVPISLVVDQGGSILKQDIGKTKEPWDLSKVETRTLNPEVLFNVSS